MRVYHVVTCVGKSHGNIKEKRHAHAENTCRPTSARNTPSWKVEVLPNAIHTIAVQAITESYGVVGITAPRLRNGQAVFLPHDRLNQGVQIRIVDNQITVEVYVALEYGLRISEIAHNIMSAVKFSIEKMLGVPVAQVNVNVQGLSQDSNK